MLTSDPDALHPALCCNTIRIAPRPTSPCSSTGSLETPAPTTVDAMLKSFTEQPRPRTTPAPHRPHSRVKGAAGAAKRRSKLWRCRTRRRAVPATTPQGLELQLDIADNHRFACYSQNFSAGRRTQSPFGAFLTNPQFDLGLMPVMRGGMHSFPRPRPHGSGFWPMQVHRNCQVRGERKR